MWQQVWQWVLEPGNQRLCLGVVAGLVFGWIVAFAGSTIGVLAAVALDLPAGPSIVACLVALLLALSLVAGLRKPTAG